MKAFNDLAISRGWTANRYGRDFDGPCCYGGGLFVCIPAVVAYNYYSKQVRGVLQSLDSVKELALAYAKKKGM